MRTAVLFVCFVSFVFFVSPSAFAQQFDPRHRFRVIPTEHFVVYFHEGEQAMAERLARVAEETWSAVRAGLGRTAAGRTHVILVDQTDMANGWATPIPRDTIAIYAVSPSAADSLRADDWLRVVFTHEYTHILHLHRSEGWARVARRVFGRIPLAYPNLFLPGWQIEGLAVFEESRLTGEGRLHSGNFRAIVDEAALARQFLPIDRVNGGLARWPGGQAPYAYGAGFHAHLAQQYGVHTLTELADRTARSLPYFGSLAFRRVYGKSLETLWDEYQQASMAAVPPAVAAADAPQRLTHHEYFVVGPRFADPGCGACAGGLYYSVRNADELPSLYKLQPTGPSPRPERVGRRIFGSTIAPGKDRFYFDQQEVRRNAGMYSDLFSLDPVTGRVRVLTREARVIDPDISPDQRSLAAVRLLPDGGRELVLVRLASPDAIGDIASLLRGPGAAQFSAPRWSPDGRSIVVERDREILVVDIESKAVRTLTSNAGERWATPTWLPEGRGIVAAGAIGDEPFNLFQIDAASGTRRQLTRTTGGATWPVVAPDGRSIVYVGQTATGYDLFRLPYSPGPEDPGLRTNAPQASGPPAQVLGAPDFQVRGTPYRPWATLPPTAWFPLIDKSEDFWRLGAAVAGTDVLGYHNYSAAITALIGGPSTASMPQLNWDVAYVYGRWRPAMFGAASRTTSLARVVSQNTDDVLDATREETDVEVGVAVPIAYVAKRHLGIASFLRGSTRLAIPGDEVSLDRAAARFAWSTETANHFGKSVSLEGGLAIGATAELVRRGLGATADSTTLSADARLYVPGLRPHHVVAIRGAAGATTGDPAVGRIFHLGGADSNGSLIDFGSNAISLLRGFSTRAFAGTHVALLNVDYRLPIARVERGIGTLPLFLHTIHASVFADVGQVWTRQFDGGNLKTSFGGEIAARLVLGYGLNVSIAGGVARGRDGAGRIPDQTTWFGRVGYAF